MTSLAPPAEAEPEPIDRVARLLEEETQRADATAEVLQERLRAERERIKQRLVEIVEEAKSSRWHLDTGELEALIEKPWCIVPLGKGEYRIVVPRCVEYHVGLLERSTSSFNIFRVNKYARWLGNVPDELMREFQFGDALSAVVQDGFLHVRSKEDQDAAWEKHGKHLTRREGDRKLRVKEGSEFDLIADLIDNGTLPFVPKPVEAEHFLPRPAWRVLEQQYVDGKGFVVTKRQDDLKLRPYQQRAYDEFLKRGAVGIYWPPSGGKTIISLWIMAHLKGPFLVVVPTSTLEEQWRERLAKYLDRGVHVDVVTYAGLAKIIKKGLRYRVGFFDECHTLPANTFAKAAVIPMDYRVGLSATPYREDGRTDYIFALTGWPIGLDWNELVDLGIIEVPTITLSVQPDVVAKTDRLAALLKDGKRTIVFCDGIDEGKRLASRFGCEFVFSSTNNRLDVIRRELKRVGRVVVSRVGDEGVSLQELERVIEVGFHGGSRRQEGQRLGRLFHGAQKGEHWILMTRDEHERFEKRLLAIREKGFRIRRDTA